jgi:hypothetical protein
MNFGSVFEQDLYLSQSSVPKLVQCMHGTVKGVVTVHVVDTERTDIGGKAMRSLKVSGQFEICPV